MKGLGLRAGVSDIIAVHAGRIFALELVRALEAWGLLRGAMH
jgi:hypothetical protein